ncbi:MAG: crossover junction endodeoxyribonuclease RuvC [Planctomycetaceae bacterium]|nr:MAG: crossover junction endodeoxyribonuclease RuvC [Planctomycetaceae bacterium]
MDGAVADEVVLGVDPGLNNTGYGVLRVSGTRWTILEAGVVRSHAKATLGSRLVEIHRGITEVFQAFQPSVMALENLYSHYKHPQTAILMGHARGVICLAAAQCQVEIANYAATQIKKTLTGSGRAPKAQVQHAICREFCLTDVPEPPDVADALAIALCHIHLRKPR